VEKKNKRDTASIRELARSAASVRKSSVEYPQSNIGPPPKKKNVLRSLRGLFTSKQKPAKPSARTLSRSESDRLSSLPSPEHCEKEEEAKYRKEITMKKIKSIE